MAAWRRTAVRNIPEYQRNEDLENLFAFGYASKLFRDDAKAKFLDQGRHLIPWMGDPSLMIDRYDGRGHLHDLRPFDSENQNRDEDLSEEERMIEQLCDEERYLELHTDVDAKQLYEEEEMKRLNEAIYGYSAVSFSYDQGQGQGQHSNHNDEPVDEDDEPYYAPPELQMPGDIVPPETIKLNAIIEKTALFISKHSAQMEIMIKTKQKDNAQFDFLNYTSELNPYYKHVVKMIKSGKYQPLSQRKKQDSQSENKEGYLHPSLSKGADEPPVIKEQTREEFMQSVSSKLPSGQIVNTPYAKLLSNLSKHTGRNSPQPSVTMPPASSIGQPEASAPFVQDVFNSSVLPPGGPTMLGIQTMSLSTNGQPPPPGTVPPGPLPSIEPDLNTVHYKDAGALSPVSGTQVVPPPPDQQPVIDKMAIYVAKNGPEFELIVRRKNDTRFDFLNAGHVHNAYYEHKKLLYLEEIEKTQPKKVEKKVKKKELPVEIPDDKTQQSKSISFSLKSKENTENMSFGLRTTALLYDSSDDEDGSQKRNGDDLIENASITPADVSTQAVAPDLKSIEESVKKQAEVRLKDKLANAAREKLAQAARENHLKSERKRKAAMFINMLKTSQPTQPASKPETNQAEASLVAMPEMPSPTLTSPMISAPPSPAPVAAVQSVDSQGSTPVPLVHSSHSPSLARSCRLSRSRSPSPRRRSRSPRRTSPIHRRRSRSPKRRHKRSRTPPSSYDVRLSPVRKRRSPSPSLARSKRTRRHSRSRSKDRSAKSKRLKSRSRSRSKTRNKSPSSRSGKHRLSPSKNNSKKTSSSRSQTRKRSRSRNRKRSRSRSKTRKSKSHKKKKKRSNSRSPKKRSSEDKRSHKHKSRDKSIRERKESITDVEITIIPDEPDTSESISEDHIHLIDSDTSDSGPSDSTTSSPVRVSEDKTQGRSCYTEQASTQKRILISPDSSPENHKVLSPITERLSPLPASISSNSETVHSTNEHEASPAILQSSNTTKSTSNNSTSALQATERLASTSIDMFADC